ncbi:hypothetical protein EVAR_58449_1 [Eumeta japonica]|uniref:Uncharacterized protein n=1 Tax=Eumeta variegata TaxID=151549 RepID=A0A4C1Z6Q6_EUMVA|nr:hypothetical protein EVAR_58449_1 [Eumeta japonica]
MNSSLTKHRILKEQAQKWIDSSGDTRSSLVSFRPVSEGTGDRQITPPRSDTLLSPERPARHRRLLSGSGCSWAAMTALLSGGTQARLLLPKRL